MNPKTNAKSTEPLTIKLDEREMIFQRIQTTDPHGRPRDHFYVCRHYGSRDCWIESKVFNPDILKKVFAIPFAWREIEVDGGQTIKIISIDWLLANFEGEPRSVQWLENISRVFDFDNSHGQCIGTMIYQNP
jgi:hypothetical protein